MLLIRASNFPMRWLSRSLSEPLRLWPSCLLSRELLSQMAAIGLHWVSLLWR